MKENLTKCTIKTVNGLIIECELTDKTIKELKSKNLISIYKIN